MDQIDNKLKEIRLFLKRTVLGLFWYSIVMGFIFVVEHFLNLNWFMGITITLITTIFAVLLQKAAQRKYQCITKLTNMIDEQLNPNKNNEESVELIEKKEIQQKVLESAIDKISILYEFTKSLFLFKNIVYIGRHGNEYYYVQYEKSSLAGILAIVFSSTDSDIVEKRLNEENSAFRYNHCASSNYREDISKILGYINGDHHNVSFPFPPAFTNKFSNIKVLIDKYISEQNIANFTFNKPFIKEDVKRITKEISDSFIFSLNPSDIYDRTKFLESLFEKMCLFPIPNENSTQLERQALANDIKDFVNIRIPVISISEDILHRNNMLFIDKYTTYIIEMLSTDIYFIPMFKKDNPVTKE